MSVTTIPINSASFAATDLCVKCGLCLPHCPTYRLSRDENASPRGRLALMQAVAENKLGFTPALRQHLDQCLGCRRCERVCPAKVPYGRLLDDFRAAMPRRTGLAGLARRVLANTAGRAALAAAARGYARSGWRPVLRRFVPLGLEVLAHQAKAPALQAHYPALGTETARVALFVGCTGAWLDADTLRAAIAVLTRLGAAVALPAGQGCCGALQWHAGDRAAAAPLLENNRRAFAGAEVLVSFASGCGAFLQEQTGAAKKVLDLSRFLLDLAWPAAVALQPLPIKVGLHTPCTLADAAAAAELLCRIPELTLLPLPSQPACCGAAGTYLLEHQDSARRLRDEVVEQIAASGVDCVVTSNVGCAGHLRAGLAARGMAVEVLHPVMLIARSMGWNP
ncbi:MAG: (Fe-S)-binding protein [Methylococcaceae bacterium]|nr:MAG: (Fe-S)-binding protein [Methylococcaceae bacterium]